MIDSEITPNRCNHIWLCNHSPDGDTLQLQNGGRPSDIAHSYTSSTTHLLFWFSSGRKPGGVGGRVPGKARTLNRYRVAMAVWLRTAICRVGLSPSGTAEPKSRSWSSVESLQTFSPDQKNYNLQKISFDCEVGKLVLRIRSK